MKISISQPAYLPWLGYFERINYSDFHVVLNHVQMDASSKTKFINRNKIKTPNGWAWLTIPLVGNRKAKISELKMSSEKKWVHKHKTTIMQNYCNSKYFHKYWPSMSSLFKPDNENLQPFIWNLTLYMLEVFKINTKFVFSSCYNIESNKSDLILDLCNYFKADQYLSGPLGKNYLDRQSFKSANVEIKFHNFQYGEYPQQHGAYIKNLSAIDFLFNCGGEMFQQKYAK